MPGIYLIRCVKGFIELLSDGESELSILTDEGWVWESWTFGSCLVKERDRKSMVGLESEIQAGGWTWRELRGR